MYVELEGKVVMVTGASSGLGEVLARKFAENKCVVYLGARSQEKLELITEEIRSHGFNAQYLKLDVTDPNEVEEIAKQIVRRENKLDIWVNNAGSDKKASIYELTPELVHEITEVNYYGLVYGTIEAAKQMRKHGGDIVQILSTSAFTPRPNEPVYAAAKSAAEKFSDSVRDDLKKNGIRVIKIYPGGMATEFFKKANLELPQNSIDPSDIADTVLHILSQPQNVNVEARIYRNV